MTKKAQNVEFVAGDHCDINVAVTGRAAVIKDLAGATIKWVLYDDANSALLLTKTTTSGITITAAGSGLFTVALLPADTVSIAPGLYYHECEITDNVSNIATVFIGHVTILPTRA